MKLNKNEKNMLIALGATAVLGALILVAVFSSEPQEVPDYDWESQQRGTNRIQQTNNSRTFNSNSSGSSNSRASGVSLTSFEQHNTANSCWVVIDGLVYDISNYLDSVSRINEIVPYCGTFAFEQVFISRTGANKAQIIQSSSLVGPLG